MTSSTLFTAHNSHCPVHPAVTIPFGAGFCSSCQELKDLMSKSPPFDVVCTDNKFNLVKGKTYVVFVVVRAGSGKMGYAPGFCLKLSEGEASSTIYPATMFQEKK